MRKPIEMEVQFLAIAATESAIANARKQADDGAALQFPAYQYESERIYTSGKLMRVARTYRYSRIRAAKLWILEKLGRRKQADPIRHFGS